eukprot:PITA_07342
MEAPESSVPPGDPPPEVSAFRKLISNGKNRAPSASQQKFIKRMDSIPSVALPEEDTCKAALNLEEKGLIGQFIGLWPSPKSMEDWTQRNWQPLIKNGVKSYFVGKGYFVFVFESSEDRNLIFRNGPYFMGPQGLYLNQWNPDFDPSQDVPSAVPVWVRLPHLPLHCWNQKSFQTIGNALGKYIDQALPFKCRHCHGYGHFAKNCKKKAEEQVEKQNEEQWTLIQRTAQAKKDRGKSATTSDRNNVTLAQETGEITKGAEEVHLDPPIIEQAKENLEEIPQENKEGKGIIHIEVSQGSPTSPTYAEVTKKKIAESSESLEEELFERPLKRPGRRSRKEKREEEAERLKTQGSQSTIEMTIGRSNRPRSSKGGSTPSTGK